MVSPPSSCKGFHRLSFCNAVRLAVFRGPRARARTTPAVRGPVTATGSAGNLKKGKRSEVRNATFISSDVGFVSPPHLPRSY